ncbi:MAG: AMP-binding protein [Lachnospiraceae bacterium]|nr:AMP-binding protein [Lachnospiraceae bacterium]
MENKFGVILEDLAERKGNTVFLLDAREESSLTYGAFRAQVCRTAKKLEQAGIRPGARVLMMMDNSIAFAVNFFAITGSGRIAVPVNTGLKWKELRYILEDTRAEGIFVQPEYDGILKEAAERSSPERHVFNGDGEELLLFYRLYRNSPRDLPEHTAMLMYTSGTTGHPKGVMLSYENLLAKTRDIIKAHQLTDSDRVLCVMPWFHINGLVITLLTPLVSEQQIVIGGKFSVSRFWGYVEKYKITWFSGVPAMYSHMLARGIPEYGCHSGLRFARSASCALPKAVLQEFERLCGIPVIESYGITEGCAQITTNPLPPAIHKAGSVGLAYGNRIRVVKLDGTDAFTGEQGEVWIRGENITCGYYHKPEITEKSFTDGWFHSGDMGYLDGDGYLFLNGRIKELINRSGEKFSPLEIDEVLYQLPQVELAAAVGVPDEVYGEEVACFIKKKEGASLTEEEVKARCREELADYKVPRKVFFVDEIPQGGNGKIQRLRLLELYHPQFRKR